MELAEKNIVNESVDPLSEFLSKGGLVIPNKYLAHYLQKVIDNWETGMIPSVKRKSKLREGQFNEFIQQKKYCPKRMVAQVLHMNPQKLDEILSGEGTTKFFMVDRILSELELTYLWYEDEALALAYSLVK